MEDRFRNNTIEDFAGRLGSAEPTPGGGAAAALESALGAALLMMVANCTIGKGRYASFEELNRKVLAEASALRDRLMDGTDRDAEAFGGVSAAYKLPNDSEDEKTARARAIAAASLEASDAPLAVMRDSLYGLELALSMMGSSNPKLESDVVAAALSFNAGLQISAVNIDANLGAIIKEDLRGAEKLQKEADDIRRKASRIIAEITDK